MIHSALQDSNWNHYIFNVMQNEYDHAIIRILELYI